MRISVAFSGPAGKGVNTAGILLGNLMSSKGYNVVGNKQYSSVIKGGNNIFILYISDESYFLTKKIDLFFSFDNFGYEKNSKLYDINEKIDINISGEYFINSYAFGSACKILGIGLDELIIFANGFFKRDLDKNILSIQAGYAAFTDLKLDLSNNVGDKKDFYFGNEITGKGAIAGGLGFYSAYPMTPATSLINVITKDPNVVFYQGEDEIAVAMAMLGAKFAGKRAMCGTSGGGFALMSESISFSMEAEIGGVYILCQRAGPSTGTPTFSEQGDIDYALTPTFGDLKPIVIYPSSFEQAYELISKSLNWSDIYQHPLIFLLDKEFGESHISTLVGDLKTADIFLGKKQNNPEKGFARYSLSLDGISEYTVPGQENGEYITSSYEHDEYGVSIDDPKTKVEFTEKRAKKLETFVINEFNETYFGYDVLNKDAKNFFVTVGFNNYALNGFVNKNPDWGIITVKNLFPLDFRLKEFMKSKDIQKLVFVEQNMSGQLQRHIVNSFEFANTDVMDKVSHIRKYDLYPIFEEDVYRELNK